MATHPKIRSGVTLEEFLRWPDADEQPYKEFIDGKIEVKVSPQKKHNVLELGLCQALNQFATPGRLGLAFPELRCTFEGRSIIPDVVFLVEAHIACDDRGEYVDETPLPPDIQVEIISPDQSETRSKQKLVHSTAHGCRLGWLIHPYRRTIDVYRPGVPPERLASDGFLDGVPVLPGFRLAVSEVFGWLRHREPTPNDPGAGPA
jgi:Uma2 family endonuclease